MREEVRTALDGLVTALEAHAAAAAAVARPDIPDPLPQASRDLVAAVAEYRRVVEHWTGAHVPLAMAELQPDEGTDSVDSLDAAGAAGEDSDSVPHRDDIDWAGDAERWR